MIRAHATGFDDYVESDRPALYATAGSGNTEHLEIHLELHDPTETHRSLQGWFTVADLQAIINRAVEGTL